MVALQPHLKVFSDADLVQIVLAFALWFALVVLALLPIWAPGRCPLVGPGWNMKRLHGLYLVLLLVALVVWRAPELFFNEQYNVDESQFLSIAQRMTSDGVAWRSGDGGSAGPLDCYILTWPALLGLPFGYLEARLTSLACLFVALVFLLKSVSLILGRRLAPLFLLAVATFYLFAWKSDFIRYSGEDLPTALLSVGGWFILLLVRKPTWTRALMLGVVLGAIPFTKLQAAPIAVALFGITSALVLFHGSSPRTAMSFRLQLVLAMLIGGFLVPVLILAPVIATGNWSDFTQRYLLFGVQYGNGFFHQPVTSYRYIVNCFVRVNTFIPGLLIFSGFLLILRFIFRAGRVDRPWCVGLAVSGSYLLVTVLVILKPRLPFPHYLLLLPCPLVLFAAWSMRGIRTPPLIRARYSAALPLLFLLLCVFAQLGGYARHLRERPLLSDRPAPDPVTPAIQALAQPTDTMAIWGWAPEYFVQTGLRSATRDIVVAPGRDSDECRGSFLSEIQEVKPRVFIDAVGAGYYPDTWPHPIEKAHYTMYPPLADYIDTHYRLQSEIVALAGNPPVLIFIRAR